MGASLIVAALGIGAGSTNTANTSNQSSKLIHTASLKQAGVEYWKTRYWSMKKYARKQEIEKGRVLRLVTDLRSRLARLSPHPVGTASHLAGWLCIHRREGAWNASTGNGYYGGLQMTYGWMGLVKDASKLSPAQQMAAAETGYRQSGYSDSWMRGQWPNTYPPCAGLF